MREKSKSYRNYTQKKKPGNKNKASVSLEDPVPSKQEASYSFITNNDRFIYWIKCFLLRYWEDFQESFDIHWEDAVDNENIYFEHIIRVSEKPADTDEHGSTADGTINRVLYTVTVYRTNNKIQIQGNSRQHWVRKEFPELKKVIDDSFSESVETRSIVKSYNKLFDTDFDMDFFEDSNMTAYVSTPSRDPEQRKTPPILIESVENSHKPEKAIIAPADLIADDQLPQEKRIIKLNDHNEAVNLPVRASDKKYQEKIDILFDLVKDLTAKLKSLENENEELKNQVETLKANLQLPDVQQLQNDINHTVENKIKEFQMNVTQKLDKVTEQKIETINTEKDEMNAKFENHKMIIKSSISSDKKLLEEKIDTLTLSLEKSKQ